MKWLKELLSDAKAVLLAPVTNILCGTGAVLVLASFIEYDKTSGLSLHGKCFWPMALVGILFAAAGALLFYFTGGTRASRLKLDYAKGVEVKRSTLTILIKTGEIQTITDATRNSAIVLPANTAFSDDCATDTRSTMGAFFGAHFPGEIAALPQLFRQVLDACGAIPNADGQYAPGTTITLPDRFSRPATVIVTASTTRTQGTGMTSTPHMICNCVEGFLKATADKRIDTVFVPLLGSGHGGVDRGLALLFMLLALLHFSKLHHHLTRVHIVILPKDVAMLNESKELRQIVAL